MGVIEQHKIEEWIVKRLRSLNKSFTIAGHTFDIRVNNIIWHIRTDLDSNGICEGVFIVDASLNTFDLIGIARWICGKLSAHNIVVDIREKSMGRM